MSNAILLLPIFFPIVAGVLVYVLTPLKNRKTRELYLGCVWGINAALVFFILIQPDIRYVPLYLAENLPIIFKTDGPARLFTGLVSVMWILVGVFGFEYMKHEKNEERFFMFYTITLGILVGLGFSGNLMTLYLCYEAMTLLTLPLVLHTQTKDAISATLKYLYYSIAGAAMTLVGFFFIYIYGTSLEFTPGGVLDPAKLAGSENAMLIAIFLTIIGFGAKAGMFPLHAWLPTAHPVAPAPASAVLSGVITKAGVLGIVRVVFYLAGADFIRDTWVQYAWMSLTLLTVFMGSMLAFKEDLFKRRLAYSSVSQVSYVLFGLSTLTAGGVLGGFMHIIFHSLVKDALFLSAGAIIYMTHMTNVSDYRGIGKQMPITMWCFTLVSVTLVGIPPTSGFISKWYLATGSLVSGAGALEWIGPAVLLLSALLTAGYLLSITISGFFPGSDFDYAALEKKEANWYMTVPLVILTVLAVWFGIFPNPLAAFLTEIVNRIV